MMDGPNAWLPDGQGHLIVPGDGAVNVVYAVHNDGAMDRAVKLDWTMSCGAMRSWATTPKQRDLLVRAGETIQVPLRVEIPADALSGEFELRAYLAWEDDDEEVFTDPGRVQLDWIAPDFNDSVPRWLLVTVTLVFLAFTAALAAFAVHSSGKNPRRLVQAANQAAEAGRWGDYWDLWTHQGQDELLARSGSWLSERLLQANGPGGRDALDFWSAAYRLTPDSIPRVRDGLSGTDPSIRLATAKLKERLALTDTPPREFFTQCMEWLENDDRMSPNGDPLSRRRRESLALAVTKRVALPDKLGETLAILDGQQPDGVPYADPQRLVLRREGTSWRLHDLLSKRTRARREWTAVGKKPDDNNRPKTLVTVGSLVDFAEGAGTERLRGSLMDSEVPLKVLAAGSMPPDGESTDVTHTAKWLSPFLILEKRVAQGAGREAPLVFLEDGSRPTVLSIKHRAWGDVRVVLHAWQSAHSEFSFEPTTDKPEESHLVTSVTDQGTGSPLVSEAFLPTDASIGVETAESLLGFTTTRMEALNGVYGAARDGNATAALEARLTESKVEYLVRTSFDRSLTTPRYRWLGGEPARLLVTVPGYGRRLRPADPESSQLAAHRVALADIGGQQRLALSDSLGSVTIRGRLTLNESDQTWRLSGSSAPPAQALRDAVAALRDAARATTAGSTWGEADAVWSGAPTVAPLDSSGLNLGDDASDDSILGRAMEGRAAAFGSIVVDDDETWIAAGGQDGKLRVWTLGPGERWRLTQKVDVGDLKTTPLARSSITSMALGRRGRLMAVGVVERALKDSKIGLWSTVYYFERATDSSLFRLASARESWPSSLFRLASARESWPSSITSVALSPNARRCAVGFDDGKIELIATPYSVEEDKPPTFGVLKTLTSPPTSLCFTPDGNGLASGSASGRVELGPSQPPQKKNQDKGPRWFQGHVPGAATGLTFSRNGALLVAAADRGLGVWQFAELDGSPSNP